MRTELLEYELPKELIATRPLKQRDGGRMCVVHAQHVSHQMVRDLVNEVTDGDLLVLNETRVRRARLSCCRPMRSPGQGGGKVELLFLRELPCGSWEALARANRPVREGDELESPGLRFCVVRRLEGGTLMVRPSGDLEQELAVHGAMPIPPYMERNADARDIERYQTVFSKTLGSAAAPTAGLHLSEQMLTKLELRGVRLARVLLHVGIGTFRPVAADDLDQHAMHSEYVEVGEDTVALVAQTRAQGGRVVAIGTTVVRALESACLSYGQLAPFRGETRLLIQPGYQFSAVDALLTNFHQPKSTLLALVSAFAGRERVLAAYRAAVQEGYRFLSYGDAMWIPRRIANENG